MVIWPAQGFRITGPISRSTLYSTRPYQVTLGGFIGRDRAILLHAERAAPDAGIYRYWKINTI